jgi:chitinase
MRFALALCLLVGGCLAPNKGTAPGDNPPPSGGNGSGGDGSDAGTDGGAGPGGTPSDADMSGPVDAGPPALTTEYAPYFYTWGWGSTSYAFSSLVDMKKLGGPAAVTIAFVLGNGGCKVTTDIHDNLADVKAFIAAGGHVKASFGGADGTYLETQCADAASLASAITGFVDDTGVTDLDFDIEQGTTTSNATINARRATALKTVQDSRHIRVAFTLPVNPDGLDSLGLAVVKSALDAGVTVSYVNVMTMDYGNGTNLATTPESSVDATAKQLQGLIKNLSLDAAYHMVGITPMIGHNDDTEVFSLTNAQTLIAYAKQKKVGLVAFWSIQRDEQCAGATNLDLCNGSGTSTFQFSKIFAAVLP